MEPFVKAGAFGCKTPQETAERSDIVLTSLMDDQSMLDAVTGESGILAGLKKGGIHICLTTISVKAAEKLERLHRKNGCIYLSGPVVGRPDAAAEGKLKTFLSGDVDAIERCKPLVESYTAMALPIGSTASEAIAMKICANYMAITQLEMMGDKILLFPIVLLISVCQSCFKRHWMMFLRMTGCRPANFF